MASRFDIVIGVDMETDVGSFTDFYNGIQKGMPRLLDIFAKNNAKAEGIANGTYQGAGAAIGDALGGVLDTAKSIFGKGGDDGGYEDYPGGSPETKSVTTEEEGSGKLKWILIAVGAAVAIAVVLVLILKKKKK